MWPCSKLWTLLVGGARDGLRQGNAGRGELLLLLRALVALSLLGCLGGFVFRSLEREAEVESYEFNRAVYKSLADSVDFDRCHDVAFKKVGYCRRHEELEQRLRTFSERTGNSIDDARQWTWLGSSFFIFHMSSTVGYAEQGTPRTDGGRLAAIFFGIAGIPLFGAALLLSSARLLRAVRAVSSKLFGPCGDAEEEQAHLVRLAAALGVVMWFGAALLFSLLEGWSYARAFFFCFVTFTTVGIGSDMPSTLAGRFICAVYIYLSLSLSMGFLRALLSPRDEAAQPLLTANRSFASMSSTGSSGGRGAAEHTPPPPLLRGRRWAPCACFFAVLLLCACAAVVFPALERKEELARNARARAVYEDLIALSEFKGCSNPMIRKMGFCRNADWFRHRTKIYFGPHSGNSMVDRGHWTAFGSASFMLSVASTIGYGSQSPHTTEGKMACVALGVLAVPLFGYCVLAWGMSLDDLVRKLLEKAHGAGDDGEYEARVQPLVALCGLVTTFWLVGAFAFCIIEDWDYPTSMYFCFVTLSAVGYANVMPRTLAGKALMLLYILVGLTCVASLLQELVLATLASGSAEEAEIVVADMATPQAVGGTSRIRPEPGIAATASA